MNNQISKYHKENGIFIFFGDFGDEDDFPSFLDFLKTRLGVSIGEPSIIVYLTIAEFTYQDKLVKAMARDDIGCFLKVELGFDDFADELIRICS